MFNTIMCNTKENKGTSTLHSFVLNFVLWNVGYGCEELSTIPWNTLLITVKPKFTLLQHVLYRK